MSSKKYQEIRGSRIIKIT